MSDEVTFPYVELEFADSVATVWLDRPERRNALGLEMMEGLKQAIDVVRGSKGVAAMVLRGRGSTFCAGADLKEMLELSPEQATSWGGKASMVLQEIQDLPMATLAVVQGPAIGVGFTLGLACDLLLMRRGVTFSFPELKHGLVPGGTLRFLINAIGHRRAMSLLLTGEELSADQGLDLGVVTHVCEDEELEPTLAALCSTLSSMDPHLVEVTKRLGRIVSDSSDFAGVRAGVDATAIGRLARLSGQGAG